MTTGEVVARLAMAFHRLPHEVWAWPLHYYLSVRHEWLKISGLASDGAGGDDDVERRTVGPDITVETIPAR